MTVPPNPYDPPPPDPYGTPAAGAYGTGPPGAPYPYAYPYPDPYALRPQPTNTLAIAALVCAFVFAPLGIVFGHISLSQIRRTGEAGRGLAIASLVIGYALTALTLVTVVLLVAFMAVMARDFDKYNHYGSPSYSFTASPAPDVEDLPAFAPPANLGADCSYPAAAAPASKPVARPRAGRVPTEPAHVAATIATDRGNIGVELDNAKSPCTVNSFVSLAQQGYFDGTSCHRLTANKSLSVLQCGDPTATGSGGPGYTFADEYPTNQYPDGDAGLGVPLRYPRGTLAMANAGTGTNGSQFFIVYADSKLPPTYTVFGSVDETGMVAVDRVAAGGVTDGNLDGKPALPVTIESVRLD
jgi:peptidyl-prolyl cis-trans isomerase B (cyclophilin B)